MANKLREMGSLSAGKREENIYKVFAYLHTREQFHPVNLRSKVQVSDRTILSYLNQIQEAQLLTEPYRERLLELKATEQFRQGSKTDKELSILDQLENKWLSLAESTKGIKEERKRQLEQFIFTREGELETLWQRLEFSILFFEMMKG
jgi:replicative DNA helicase